MPNLVDLYAPSAPGSLMRSIAIMRSGVFRLARRDAELYSVQIVSSGSWARARAMHADGSPIWEQPSTFTGSFWLGAAARGALLIEIASSREHEACNLTINWRERGRDIV